jgi:DNA-binding LytR/AlgR family response regulator
VIDDEFPATQVLESFIKKMPELQLSGSFTEAIEALAYANENKIDIVFIDIQMPDLTGIEFIQSLRKSPKIIFTTAYDQYAVEGFKLEATDYLLKPFSFDRFAIAANKAIKQIELEATAAGKNKMAQEAEFISVKSDYKLHKILLSDIDYIEGLKAYVSIFVNGKRFIVLESLKNLEENLPATKFIRTHKSFIVPIDKIKNMEGNMLDIGAKKVPIGKSYKELVLSRVFKQ